MQAIMPRKLITASSKRVRCISFPGGFEERLLRRLAARSAFVRSQLDCFGEDVTSGRLQLPEEEGNLWIDCILSSHAELRATGDKTLAAYLKASEFFQDWAMVKELAALLSAQLFSTAPEAGSTSSAKRHVAEVTEGLSSNLVMDVLRSAPGSLQEQLPRLPQSLASLAALAHIPSLAAVCSPAPESADQGHCQDGIALNLCVCTSPFQAVAIAEQEAADGTTGASMWLQRTDATETTIIDGLFITLESRPGVVVCRLLAQVSSLQGVTVCLPDSTCLLLGPGTLKLRGVTFQGGSVGCSGASCQVTFEDTVFDRCTLMVLSAAQATLCKAAVRNTEASQSGLGLLVHGACSRVAVQGGTLTGGSQGLAVQAGGHLEATGLTITEVCAVGAEVQGEGSHLSLTDCKLHSFSKAWLQDRDDSDFDGDEHLHSLLGVHVHSSSSAHLSSLSVSLPQGEGVRLASGSGASLDGCNVSVPAHMDDDVGMLVCGSSTSSLTSCTLSGGTQGGAGLRCHDVGSSVHASKCRFIDSSNGASVSGGTLTAVACTSSANYIYGFHASGIGSTVELTDCFSDKDGNGCVASNGATLKATRVQVTETRGTGFRADPRANMVLQDCSAKGCKYGGAYARDTHSQLHVEGCTFQQNRDFGVLAEFGGVVTVKGCHSSQHSKAGYLATGAGEMRVISSVSEGDKQGCMVEEGGRLTMEDVTVDGVLQSGHLPPPS